ncbi:hydroxysqualene dehydroxylase HpnE [Pollutimonas bauzanensis]|uniref:Squalene-associated FAD-dependent desaturase n=1 Tax=Pollutimonas bauzanensis TaxID=658167 RepID=A0A1M5ZQQ5_9BURK|nr:hydroxysqualene dehydroxylase HpnE [Pollutimonas bauzanensis]SHI26531.1 squalene-associated FAD-dependent desaturase [Pollutimonas bauzanensis]
MNIAVIGGGWAGLSAAVRLRQYGFSVTVFEAARTLGGRARRVESPALGAAMDNGQHILLGAYTETLALMRELGLDTAALLHRQRLAMQSADGGFDLRACALPAPLHLLGAIVGARGLGIAERLRMIAITQGLKRRKWLTAPGLTVAQWLAQGRQSPLAVRMFWQPLCLAALNTPPDQACAQLFAGVLRDSLGGPRDACDVLIPRVDLSQLWPDQVERYAPAHAAGRLCLRRGHAVRHLAATSSGVELDGKAFDAVVVAGNAPAAHRLLRQLPPSEAGARYLAMLAAFEYLPIATLTLQLERPWRLPQPMLLLRDDPGRMQFGQWLFDRSALPPGAPDCLVHIVISDARAMMALPREDAIAATIAQAREQSRRLGAMPRVLNQDIIVEKRATFAAVPGLQRPANGTPWPRVWAAGDWTDTGYPAVLEGAVRSGRDAARAIQRASRQPAPA